jgi:uncharacterized protein
VNDFANVLDAAARSRLERVLAEGERTSGAQVVIAVFPSLEGESLEDFSIRLAEKWRVGRKGVDDGALILAFISDRKLRIEVGYGLEGVVPDAEASRIIRESIAPRFREGRYEAGLEAAARAIYSKVATKKSPGQPGKPSGGSRFPLVGVLGLFVIVATIVAMLVREAATTRGLTRRGYTAGRRGWGVPPVIFIPPWGGGGSGGGGGGGGSDFSSGGGSFGGGGASGDW